MARIPLDPDPTAHTACPKCSDPTCCDCGVELDVVPRRSLTARERRALGQSHFRQACRPCLDRELAILDRP